MGGAHGPVGLPWLRPWLMLRLWFVGLLFIHLLLRHKIFAARNIFWHFCVKWHVPSQQKLCRFFFSRCFFVFFTLFKLWHVVLREITFTSSILDLSVGYICSLDNPSIVELVTNAIGAIPSTWIANNMLQGKNS